MSTEAPHVSLPRARPAGASWIYAAAVGIGIGIFIGHPIVGALLGVGVWFGLRVLRSN